MAFSKTVNIKEDQMFFGFYSVFLWETFADPSESIKEADADIFIQCMASNIVPKFPSRRSPVEERTS